ncbi:hypothetical protein BHE18_16405 [Rossellomorea aquimaris]|uniref:Uncharacterized protein n=1 Tax=Rossellomorea aquimaris TaxID=189382 RepID=A0A1J6VPP0_9BACI|nr:hypothetical protein BHE18_16405 [Rossellomorea aquimaris]
MRFFECRLLISVQDYAFRGRPVSTIFLIVPYIAAIDFRGRLRFPRVTREPPAFFIGGGTVQLQGLEAHVISQTGQEGKERLRDRFALCHTPLSKAPPLF